jgi:N-acetylmuramoyl-L-alanine amidase
MRDDDRIAEDGAGADNLNDPTEPTVPASVTFMEMMRLAAARSAAQAEAVARREAALQQIRQQAQAANQALDNTAAEANAPDDPQDTAIAAERSRREKRRREKRRRRAVGVLGGVFRSVIVVFAAAGLVATIFTWWTPSGFLQDDVRQELSLAIATSVVTLEPTIVSGHRGPENDPGAVCPDGLTEAEINFNVAQLVVRNLRSLGYTVDLLDEFDPRLDNYEAAALVSIHANTCQDYGELVTGYLISAAAARITAQGLDGLLVECVAQHYEIASGLQRREGVTVDMTDYHTFREIHPRTPAAIIELGFMLADRQLLTEQPDRLARGITDGVLCFLEPGSLNERLEVTAEAGV